jgi:hypothetical protein
MEAAENCERFNHEQLRLIMQGLKKRAGLNNKASLDGKAGKPRFGAGHSTTL